MGYFYLYKGYLELFIRTVSMKILDFRFCKQTRKVVPNSLKEKTINLAMPRGQSMSDCCMSKECSHHLLSQPSKPHTKSFIQYTKGKPLSCTRSFDVSYLLKEVIKVRVKILKTLCHFICEFIVT